MSDWLVLGAWVFGCIALGLHAVGVRLPRRRSRIIPTRPQSRGKCRIALDDAANLQPCDEGILRANEERILLAYQLGLDLALHRADKPAEFLCAGESPSSDVGFVVVRNQDA